MKRLGAVTRREADRWGLMPRAFDVLPATAPHHVQRNAHPPHATYTMSWERVVTRFSRSLTEYSRCVAARPYSTAVGGWGDPLLDAHEQLHYAIAEHFDDCKNIVASFVDPAATKDKRIKKFGAELAVFRDWPASITNAIKHNQRRLRSVYLQDQVPPYRSALGFYVEGIGQSDPWKGVPGPDEEIHPGAGATSFGWDYRYLLYGLFWTSERLAKLFEVEHWGRTEESSGVHYLRGQTEELAEAVADLPYVIFPNEYDAGMAPWVSMRAGHSGRTLRLASRTPKAAGATSFRAPRVRVNFRIHGTSYHLPLFGGDFSQ